MKTYLSAALVIVAIACPPVRAEQEVASSADAMSASAAADLPAAPARFDHVVFLARLPAPAALLKGAKAQGITITRMDQTDDRVVVVYQHSGGRTVTFAYTLLSAAEGYPVPVGDSGPTTKPVAGVVYAESTEVVYAEPRTVYYSSRYAMRYEPAWDFWAPLTIGYGIGWFGGHSHGHVWRGGDSWHRGHGGRGGHGAGRR